MPSERNYMQIYQTESYTCYNVYTKALFAYDVYFQIRVALEVDKDGTKMFQFGIMAVPLKTTTIDLQLNLHVSTWGKTIGQETLNIKNHDGSDYETRTYDFFRCEQFKIVLGDLRINGYIDYGYDEYYEYDEYDEISFSGPVPKYDDYETLNFKIALPSENKYEKSGRVKGDFKRYRNFSANINFKGRDLMIL